MKYNVSGSSIPYNVCLDTPAIDYSLFNWAQLTYPSTYKTMTTSAFISSGIPNKKVLKSCNNAFGCFENCQTITEAPFNITSNKCYDISNMFRSCYNLTKAPVIPEGVVNMWTTFEHDINLTSVPIIPNSVTVMDCTFSNCQKLTSVPIIPNSVTSMWGTFVECYNLRGDIYIHSNNIIECQDCFHYRNAYQHNLYVHSGTTTYNTFYNYLGNTTYNASLNIQLKTF